MKTIPLTLGKFATIDDADFYTVSLYKWHAERTTSGGYYAATTIRRPDGGYTTLRMHQVVWRVPPGLEVDHRDGDGLNNRRRNLRAATRKQQSHNTKSKKRGNKGLTLQKRLKKRPWQARIAVDGKQIHLGYFPTETEAATAYDDAARKYHGEFARLNNANTALSDNKRRLVSSAKVEFFSRSQSSRPIRAIVVTLSCGHTKKYQFSRRYAIGKYTHCLEC